MIRNLLIIVAVIFVPNFSYSQSVQNVDAKTFAQISKSGEGIILDVRTPQEYSRSHIQNSTLISTNDPKFVEKVKLLQKDKPLYIYCLTGSRSRAVASYLANQGFTKIYNLQRGIMEWQQAGYPLEQGGNPIASESKKYETAEFNSILNSGKVVLVDFYAPWCAPCKKMAPDIAKLEESEKKNALVVKVDIQENESIKAQYNVQSIPTLVIFKNGKEIWRNIGGMGYEEMKNKIEGLL